MRKRLKNELLFLCATAATGLYLSKNKKTAAIPAFFAGLLLALRYHEESFKGQSVVITGGSRGLGLALAKELVKEGANVTLLARDEYELEKAKRILESYHKGLVSIISCDITEPIQLENAIRKAYSQFRGLDLLINNAGSITVGPWETMTQKDFEAQMKLHVYAVINSTRFALPFMREHGSGKRIVNICSMGGRVAVPHMLPYDTSKFALAGFSQGVGAELAQEGISVTTIYPALMRTGSPIQAVFKGDHEKEFAWFQSADVFPGLSTSAESVAKQILQAARERRWELMPSLPAKFRMTMAVFFPELMGWSMGFLNRFLPRGKSARYKTGAQSRGLFDKSILTRAFVTRAHLPEIRLNQEPKADAERNMGLH